MRTRAGFSLGLSAVLALVGCGGGDSAGPLTSTTAPPAPTTTVYSGPVAPLTGMPTNDASLATKPLLTVKIDNHPQARPQFGLDRADVIVEEKVEGDLSRFMALFHSQEVDRLGPVRSLRTTDVKWLKPVGGLMAYSGGIPAVRAALPANGIVDIGADTYGPRYYKRRNDRPFEHSYYVDTSVLRELTPKDAKAAKPLFEYLREGSPFTGAGAMPASGVSGRFGGSATAVSYSWNWDAAANHWKRGTDGAPHNNEGTGQIGIRNVVIQFTEYRGIEFRDRAGSVVDEAVTTGSGDAWVLSAGQIVKGRWSRTDPNNVTTFTDANGVTIKLQPGQTWLMLLPAGQVPTVQ